ncbi:nucleotidyltransferase family protein [bacterium]|jgi:glucose-1-phosphate thymidylyltransferase|nr:nucleotidyltransferase family protein [bacterium]MBT6831455.1 nucleotidyltransferase family protein [bacterium]MBT6996361.1 nucleotidyltransferase family protein [bacterium]MBT7772428.1 nucleotidyltransferase family protein [bacterium]
MKTIILAAGYATRLHPITLDTPKPLLGIGEKPIAEHILEKLKSVEILDEIFVVTNSKFFPHFSAWAATLDFPKKITIVDDGTISNETRLGSLGDIQFVIEKFQISDDILVVAGDNLFDFSLEIFTEFSVKKNATTVALHDVQNFDLAKLYGIVAVDEDFRVTDFLEKPENPPSTLASTGVYFYARADLPRFAEFTANFDSDRAGDFLAWLFPQVPVFGFQTSGRWFDIGSIEQLEIARREFSKK